MNLKNLFKVLFTFGLLALLASSTTLAQTTWYVNNQIGNDGRNGLSASIPSPDDGVTGPKRTIGGAQGAIAESNAGDIIVVANTGVSYSGATGEPGTITANKQLTFRSSGGVPSIGVPFQVNNAAGSPNNTVVFDNGEFTLAGGLTLTQGVLSNNAELITVSGTVTRAAAAAVVNGQLKYTGTVNFSYGATMTTGDEFVPTGGSFNNLTTTAGNLTIKSGTDFTMTGVFNTAGTVDLGGGVVAITNTGAAAHTIGGNVTNGTLAFSLGGGNASIAGAFTVPTVTVTTSTSTARTLDINGPTAITGTLTVDALASVTSSGNTLVTIGTAGFSGDVLVNSGTGTVTPGTGLTTIHGNVVLNSVTTAATGSQIVFGSALTINGSVTNSASLTVSDAATWAAATSGRIVFPDAVLTITGSVVNNTSIEGAIGTTTNVAGFGQITFANTTNNVTISGAINNSSSTSIASSANPAGFNSNGLITFGNNITTAIVRADGGINNSSDFSGITGANNTNNGRIVIGGAARTGASTVGTAANRVGAVSNSSLGRAAADGNGDIIIGQGNGTASGFFGTSVTVSGAAVGGYTIFGDEDFDVTGAVTNARTHASPSLQVGVAAVIGANVTIGGNLVNSGTGTTSFNVVGGLASAGAVGISGSIQSDANGTITFPNITDGTFTAGGFIWSSGTFNVPISHNNNLTLSGVVDISGGTINWNADGGDVITITGNATFTGGSVTTTGRTTITLSSSNITMGGASSNTTFNTAATAFVVGNPSPTSLTTFTIGSYNPQIPGNFTVNNTTGLAEAVRFTGGTMTIAGSLTFTAGAITITEQANVTVEGNVTNTAGYTTTEQGRLTVGGTVAQTFGGAGTFGTIEFKNAAGINTSSAVTLTGTIYLTAGVVSNGGGAISISNSTTTPTIVRNAGSFSAAPTFVSMVNVTYIGDDKASGNEVPTATDKLNNLTVATTTGAGLANNVPSRGVVTIGTATTVNGEINVYSGQTLLIDAVTLTMKGSTITLNGDIANEGVGLLSLAATTGTTVSGSGYLPPVTIAAGSVDNVIDGPIALVHQLVGIDNERGGGDDFDPTTTSADGDLVLANGTASLTLTLSGVAFDGTDLQNITTNNANNTLTLGANTQMSGSFAHAAGTIDLGGFTLTHLGTTPAITGGALTTNGTLQFGDGTATGATLLSLNTADVTIAADVNINLAAAATTFTLDPATAGHLILAGDFTVTKGDVVLGNGANARNLTVTGPSVTLTGNGSIDVTPTGIGTFRLFPDSSLTMTYAGTPTIARLRISNDVVLAGTGTALTVSTVFTHDGGVFDFGAKDLTIEDSFTRSGGSYQATSGYMILNANGANLTVNQGSDGFSVPNLRVTTATAHNVVLTGGAGAGNVVVTSAFDVATAAAQQLTTNGKLVVNDAVTVTYVSGTLSAAPSYQGQIALVTALTAGGTVPAIVWPATPDSLVTSLRIANNAGIAVELPGSRSVGQLLDLRQGVLDLGTTADVTLTVTDTNSVVRRRNTATVALNDGSLVYNNAPDVIYEHAGGAPYAAGSELPATVDSLTITRVQGAGLNYANAAITFASGFTVNGNLTVRNDFTANGNIVLFGDLIIAVDENSNATAPVVNFGVNTALTFSGAEDQLIQLPSGTIGFGSININKDNNDNQVMLEGGNLNLDVTGGIDGDLVLTRGVLVTGDNYIQLDNDAGSADQGYTRNVVPGDISHVIGNVRKDLKIGSNPGFGRSEFPVGSETTYRPAAITILGTNTNMGVNVTVSNVDSQATGNVGLPIIDGVEEGVHISRYPGFYWTIQSDASLGQQEFDLELTSENYTDYVNVADVRMIRRIGSATDDANEWLLQGENDAYDNFVADQVVSVVNVGSVGGIRPQNAIFTFGLKTKLSVANPIPDTGVDSVDADPVEIVLSNVFAGNEGDLTFSATSTNPSIATVAIQDDSVLVVTPVANGETEIDVRATDSDNDFIVTTFTFKVGFSTGIEDLEMPTEFTLAQNYPNPFNPTTVIRFGLPEQSNVVLKVYNILGEEVATLMNGEQQAGWHEVNFNSSKLGLSSGLYVYRIEAKDFVSTKKMMLIK